jgi:outer membrane protein OmpA-like peptidoglycan-associated protein
MKTIVLVISIMVFSFFTLSAVTEKDFNRKFERAENLFKNGNFSEALRSYLELYKNDSANCNLSYKIGVCYLKVGEQQKNAMRYLKKAVAATSENYVQHSRKERRAPLVAYKLLADACHLISEFDLAILHYQKFKQVSMGKRKGDAATLEEVDRKLEMCRVGKELMKRPLDIQITNMGENINSSFGDYSPRVSADQCTMIFTSRRPENVGGKTYDGGLYFEDIYISKRKNKNAQWSKAVNIGWPINTVGNEAAVGISADGQEILIYKDDMGDGNIYSSKLKGDKWSTPVKLNSNINSPYWEPCAYLSADGNTLYFVSDRPGGYGGNDIYKSKKNAKGEWGVAVNLGPVINTPQDEYSPFMHPDGKTLYFSSRGHQTMGGYDVFSSRAVPGKENGWLAPVNIGYPINSPGDDAFYSVSPDKQRAYYSSFKVGGLGEKDNYSISFNDAKETGLSLVKGSVLNTGTDARNVVITVTDNESCEVTGVYHPNSKNGQYLLILDAGKSHNITYEADDRLFYSENQFIAEDKHYSETEKNIILQNLEAGSKVILNNIFFDFDQSKLRPYSIAELNKLYEFLTKYPKLTVEISGFADSRGSDAYNKKLSLERSRAVVQYLKSKGIQSKRMKAVGYGEPYAGKYLYNTKGDRQADRRVELRILDTK